MTLQMLILASVLVVPIVVISFVALRRAWDPEAHVEERLGKPDPALSARPLPTGELVMGDLTTPMAGLIPARQTARRDLYQELRAAGYYQPAALNNYLAVRNVLVLVPILAACMAAAVLQPRLIPLAAVVGLVIAGIGFSLARLYVQARGRARYRQIERGLPTAVDLLTLALSAGLNLHAALGRVAVEIRNSYPALAEELEITHRQAELRSLDYALQQLTERVDIPDVRNLALLLSQSERLGTDATPVLLEYSNNIRVNMRQRAEAQANRTSFWMLFPTVGCFLLAAALLLTGPVFMELRQQMTHSRDIVRESQKKLTGANAPSSLLNKGPTRVPVQQQ